MNARARFYKKRKQEEVRDVRSDLAAEQYARRMDYDGIEIQSVYGGPSPRYYWLTRNGNWTGPWIEEDWLYEYMKKDFSTSEVGEHGQT